MYYVTDVTDILVYNIYPKFLDTKIAMKLDNVVGLLITSSI